MVKAEMKNRLLFCNIELVAFCGINGIFARVFSTFSGSDFRCASLFKAASLGVMEKILMEARAVARMPTRIKDPVLSKTIGTGNEFPIKGTQ